METYRPAPDIDVITSNIPVPGFGLIPVNAFVLHGAEPLLVDTGAIVEADESVVRQATCGIQIGNDARHGGYSARWRVTLDQRLGDGNEIFGPQRLEFHDRAQPPEFVNRLVLNEEVAGDDGDRCRRM